MNLYSGYCFFYYWVKLFPSSWQSSVSALLIWLVLVPWYYYLILGFIDVQANYLVTKAFQYSSITSVTLLDCWTIPWVIILTWVFIGARYSMWQYTGAATCIIGLCLVLFSDAGVGGGGGSKPLLGDFLVIAGTLFYALSNVGEILGFAGFAGFAVASFLFYTLVPFVLKLSGATLFNLSDLTSDMWAVAICILFYHQEVDWLYYVSFGTVVMGLVIYSKSDKNPIPIRTVDGHLDGQYEALNKEIP